MELEKKATDPDAISYYKKYKYINMAADGIPIALTVFNGFRMDVDKVVGKNPVLAFAMEEEAISMNLRNTRAVLIGGETSENLNPLNNPKITKGIERNSNRN